MTYPTRIAGLTLGITFLATLLAQPAARSNVAVSDSVNTSIQAHITPTGPVTTAPSGLAVAITTVNSLPAVHFTWQSVAQATSFRIYRNGVTYKSVFGTSYVDTVVSPGTTYTYAVSGKNVYGVGPSSVSKTITVPISSPAIPAPSTNLTASAANSQVTLNWTASPGASSYNVKRSTVTGSGYDAVVSTVATTYANTGLVNGTTYFYVVSATNSAGTSANSVQASATPHAAVTIPAPPTGLTASPGSGLVALSWSASNGAASYTVSRSTTSGSGYANVATGVASTSYTNTGLTNGTTYFYVVSAANSAGTSANSTQASAMPQSAATTPAAPTGLTATPQWATSMGMAHIILSWQASSGATSYNIYRAGTLLQAAVTATTATDMAVTSGQSYSYTVAGVNASGTGAMSAAASAIAPSAPSASSMLSVPTNLVVTGLWQSGSTDNLSWSSVPGAATYNVYQYDVLIKSGLTSPSYTVPVATYFEGATYAVTAVDSAGTETIPSNIVTAQGAFDPTQPPSWSPAGVVVPTSVAAVPEWNSGRPRISLSWRAGSADYTYSVYRDGARIASGVWGLAYIDNGVNAGDTHSYAITGSNVPFQTSVESGRSASVSATALAGPPARSSSPVQITGTKQNDDSVYVTFAAVPGAQDYRVYSLAKPNTLKYSGGGLGIEMNGIDPALGADLVVEAVDKRGPFQKMDGFMGPGAMAMDGSVNSAVNGQGDPSNVPNIIAASAPFHVTVHAVTLSGSQSFFDNFRNSLPLSQMPTMDPAIVAANYGDPNTASNRYVREFQNDKWVMRDYLGDMDNTKLFFMGNHFMDTVYDGGTPRSNVPVHNNNASLVFSPKATADISGGKVLHVTFEVDPHFDGRRWCDVFVAAAGDPLINPGKFAENGLFPTVSGNMFRWEIKSDTHLAEVFLNGAGTDAMQPADWNDQQTYARIYWDHTTPLANGSMTNLDQRHKYDLYLSQTHYKLMETSLDGTNNVVREHDLPANAHLPFTNVQVYFVHQLYHTTNDRAECLDWNPEQTYWINYRPWSDERHWDNMGFEVLSTFP